MNVAPGSRLGPYEIVARIGAGGMGEVWKARDTRLDRSVAIKILSVEFAQNAQLRLRFEREARTISQLTHPHICALYDVGENYLVMELLDGESMADRLAKGAMPLHDVLRYGAQVADALDRAHRAGIVHRDLKPGNIMITKSGAKLLDFGLAKPTTGALFNSGAMTAQRSITEEGRVVGTLHYMAPEQFDAGSLDARTDIFALGAVLYEMVTGKRAFDGQTLSSVVSAIATSEPRPMSQLQPLTPPALEHMVKKCLAKDPDNRWQSARDIAEELRWISETGSQAGVPATLAGKKGSRARWLVLSVAIGWTLAVAAAIAAAIYASRWRAASRVTQTEIAAAIIEGDSAPLAVSPDGRRLAAVVVAGNTTLLWMRDLSTGEGRALAGTEGATFPFWAPDGHAIGFFAGSKLKTVNAETGAIQNICDALYGRGGTWSPLGVIVFAPNTLGPLMKVSENGGTAVAVTKLTRGPGETHRNPAFLSDGKHFLYCDADPAGPVESAELHAGSINGGFDRKVLDYASNAAYAGHWLLTIRDRNLIAQRFDPGALEIKGKPVAIAQNVEWYAPRWQSTFAVGGDTLVYEHAPQPKRQLLRLDELDARPLVVGDAEYYTLPALSPDGGRVVVNRFDAVTRGSDLWMYDLGGGPAKRLTFDARGFMADSAAFSPDGQRIAVSGTGPSGLSRLWIQPAGGGTRESLKIEAVFGLIEDWSRDGKALLVRTQRLNTGYDVDIIHLDGDRKLVPLVHGDAAEIGGRFSPNGKWIAYQSNESGRPEVYVTDYPAATAKWQVSTGGGTRPFWSADGRQLLFLAGDRIVAVAVHEGESFSADAPRPVEALGDKIVDFAVAHNGHIVALREIDPGKAPLSVVLNWQELLRGK